MRLLVNYNEARGGNLLFSEENHGQEAGGRVVRPEYLRIRYISLEDDPLHQQLCFFFFLNN